MSDYSERNERAIERGYDSYYYEREARSFAYEHGADRSNVEEYAYLFDNYAEGDMDIEDWEAVYMDLFDIDNREDIDWDDFYDWLGELYESIGG